jgi:hypothetical protein
MTVLKCPTKWKLGSKGVTKIGRKTSKRGFRVMGERKVAMLTSRPLGT